MLHRPPWVIFLAAQASHETLPWAFGRVADSLSRQHCWRSHGDSLPLCCKAPWIRAGKFDKGSRNLPRHLRWENVSSTLSCFIAIQSWAIWELRKSLSKGTKKSVRFFGSFSPPTFPSHPESPPTWPAGRITGYPRGLSIDQYRSLGDHMPHLYKFRSYRKLQVWFFPTLVPQCGFCFC